MPRSSPRLSADIVLQGYCAGAFPMGHSDGGIYWFSPDPRCILPLDQRFHVARSLRQAVRRGEFEIRVDTAFSDVITGCAERAEGTWISADILRVCNDLHRSGLAHSVESWQGGELAGGLYGVAIGGAFFGESMFTRRTNASKVALVALVERLRERQFVLLDTQWMTPHLQTFGALEIPRREYLRRLRSALELERRFAD